MQTFLPFSSFLLSAETLDKKRCWKQVEEAKQIINILECKILGIIYVTTLEKAEKIIGSQFLTSNVKDALLYKNGNPKLMAWIEHQAVKMWEGCIPELMVYFNVFLKVCKEKHHVNTNHTLFTLGDFKGKRALVSGAPGGFYPENPWWLGNENFHRAMRARLIQKDRDFYLPLFPNDEGFNDGLYLWPVMDGSKTFRII